MSAASAIDPAHIATPTWYACRVREGKMVDGMMVLVIAFGVLAALWIIIFYGSSYFGPKT